MNDITVQTIGKTTSYYINKKKIAYMRGGTLFKDALYPQHMLQQPKGWAFAVEVLADAQQRGAQRVVVKDATRKLRFQAKMATFISCGIPIERFGYEPQRCLEIGNWKVNPIVKRNPRRGSRR